ncbi:MAG: hypothetical protein APR63_15085 [Desulfuromonas sp. SDB]|nr:MAG: hypothetical protein APR63_15085 [Desulfuromonas sp. SDB]
MKYLIIILVLICVFSSVNAVTWSRIYGTSEDDYAISAEQTPDGGYIILGYSEDTLFVQIAWLLKLDEYGDSVWSCYFDSVNSNYYFGGNMDIEVDYDSGYIIAVNKLINTLESNLRIIKTNNLGIITWDNIFDLHHLSTNDYPYDIDKTSDNGYIVVCNTQFQNASTFIVKLNQNGDSIWAVNTAEEAYFTSVCEGRYGSFIATSLDAYPYPPHIVFEYDSLGNILSWHGYNNSNKANDIEMLNDSNYLVATNTYFFKIDENLDTIWSRNIGALDVEPCFDGGFVSIYNQNSDAYLSKYTNSGDTLWTIQYGSYGDDFFCCVNRTTDGGYICCGATNSWGAGGFDYYIVKTDSLGYALGVEEEFTQQYPEFPNISFENLSSGQVKISFTQPNDGNLNFSVYDLSGRMIDQPLEGFQEDGEYSITLTGYRPGVYFYRMKIGEGEWIGKFQVY